MRAAAGIVHPLGYGEGGRVWRRCPENVCGCPETGPLVPVGGRGRRRRRDEPTGAPGVLRRHALTVILLLSFESVFVSNDLALPEEAIVLEVEAVVVRVADTRGRSDGQVVVEADLEGLVRGDNATQAR